MFWSMTKFQTAEDTLCFSRLNQLLQLNGKDRVEERQLLLEAGMIERSPDQ